VPVRASGAGSLRVVPLVDLLALKLKAQGSKDLMDAAILVLMHPETDPRARELAIAYRVLDRLEHWLDDPRARAQAREELEYEARSSRKSGVGTRAQGRPATRR
jgi:hypothetical protein